jgi:hypothetical protein
MRKQVEAWQKSALTDVTDKVVIYEAFVEGKLEAPKHLSRTVHDLYFVFRAKVRRVSPTDDLESFQCVHFRIQGTGPDSAVQDDSEVERIPGSPVFPIVLVLGPVRARPPLPGQ